jgi:glycosyltransferase involved in cell wall biosynthesis
LSGKATLIIFTRNEIDGIKQIFPLIPFQLFDEIIAVDANSTDGTVEFLQERGIKVLEQRMPGRVNAAIEAMESTNGEIVVFLSGDGNEDPTIIPTMLSRLDKNDMVIASRFARGGSSDDSDDPLKIRKMMNIAIAGIVRSVWHTKITDATNGLRAIRRALWVRARVSPGYHTAELQLAIRAAKMGCRIDEVPTVEGRRVGHRRYAKTVGMAWSLFGIILREMFGIRISHDT